MDISAIMCILTFFKHEVINRLHPKLKCQVYDCNQVSIITHLNGYDKIYGNGNNYNVQCPYVQH